MSDIDTDTNADYTCNNPEIMLDGKDGGAIIDDNMNLTVDSDSSSVSSQDDTTTTNSDPVVLSKFIRIDGNVYDITNFKHPGGNIINYVGNEDTTDRFNELHSRSKKARSVLQSLPHVTDDQHNSLNFGQDDYQLPPGLTHRQQEMTSDFRDMRTTLINNGCFDTDYIHVYFRLMEIMFYFGLGSILASHNMYASMLAFIVF